MGRVPSALLGRRFLAEATRVRRRELRLNRAVQCNAALPSSLVAGHGPSRILTFPLAQHNMLWRHFSETARARVTDISVEETNNNIVEGTMDRVLHHNENNGYCVFLVRSANIDGKERANDKLKIVGTVPDVPMEGKKIKVRIGGVKYHPEHGLQYEFREFIESGRSSSEDYLIATVPGIGNKFAKVIYNHFGEETWDVISNKLDRLKEIEGLLGEKRAESFAQHLLGRSDQHLKELFEFLHEFGVSVELCKVIVSLDLGKSLSHSAVDTIRREPYSLLRFKGLSFERVDKIAMGVGVARNCPERFQVCIHHALMTNIMKNGNNTAFKYSEFVQLMVDEDGPYVYEESLVHDHISEMLEEKVIVKVEFNNQIYIQHSSWCALEKGIAERIRCIQASTSSLPRVDAVAKMAGALESSPFKSFSDGQKEAIALSLSGEKVSVLSGGPGTGKTAVLGSLVQILCDMGARIELAAPTGIAAKRLQESTGDRVDARTIHRLLEYHPKHSFKYNEGNKLETDFVIVDEASMLNTTIAGALLSALPDSCHLLLVGDNDQLPSVGPGNVLADLIGHEKIPVAKLTQLYRQSEGSEIIRIAHAVNSGNVHDSLPRIISDISNLSADESIQFVELPNSKLVGAIPRVRDFITDNIGLKELTECQILTPLNASVTKYNEEFQQLNLEPFIDCSRKFKKDDKVMQIKNNYDKGVFNWVVGKMVGVDASDEGDHSDEKDYRLEVKFDAEIVDYTSLELDQLSLAYASTVHKSQGCEYPATIIVLPDGLSPVSTRNLLYTALTRSKKYVIILGSINSYKAMVSNHFSRERCTLLPGYLQGC